MGLFDKIFENDWLLWEVRKGDEEESNRASHYIIPLFPTSHRNQLPNIPFMSNVGDFMRQWQISLFIFIFIFMIRNINFIVVLIGCTIFWQISWMLYIFFPLFLRSQYCRRMVKYTLFQCLFIWVFPRGSRNIHCCLNLFYYNNFIARKNERKVVQVKHWNLQKCVMYSCNLRDQNFSLGSASA